MKYIPILFAALLLISLVACKKKDDETPTPTEQQRNVTYKIGCSDCQVIYYKADGSEGNEVHVNSNWSYSFSGKKDSTVLLFAYNTSGAPQGVTAMILLNNDTIQQQTNWCPISGYSFVVDTLE